MCYITEHDKQKPTYVDKKEVVAVEQYLRMQQQQH